MITIHEANASDFTTLGLGALTPTECMIEEKAGGLYELTLVQPITDDYRHTLIAQHRIVKAPAPVRETPLIELNQTGSVQREIYRVATGGARLNMRATPNGKILHSYTPGTEVVKLGQNDDGTWMQVALMDGGTTGWMFTEYLQLARTETEVVSGDTPGVVQPRQTREQLFRIIDMEPDTKTRTVTAWAQHITYDLKGAIVVGEYEPDGVAADVVCAQLMARADHDVSDFHIYCAVDGKITGSYGGRNIIDCLLDPETGVAAQTGARVVRDNYDIFLLPDEERSRGVELRYGKNLLSAAMTTSVADVITRIRPVGKDADGNKLYIEENNGFVDSTRIDKYPVIYSKEIEYDVAVSDELPVNEACEQLKAKAQADFDAGCDLAGVTLNVDFIRVELTEKYKHLASAYALHMYDRVPVIDRDAGIVATVRMIGYRYDGLLDRYDKTILGDIGDVETTVQGYEIAPGSVSGTKIVPNSMSGDRLRNLSVGYGKFNAAAIGQLAANAITAVRADIRKLVAGEATIDQLYADLAAIAVAQITTANIQKANIEWADIANLTAAIAEIASAEIGQAKIGWAQIENVKVGTADIALGAITQALIQQGAVGTAQIADGSITEAKIVSLNADVINSGTLSVERLLLKGAGGLFYEINATAGGLTAAQLTEEQYKNAISGTALVARSVTADKIAAKTITANEILGGTITAAEINVANLFAAKATIAALESWLISTSVIQGLNDQLILVAGRTVGGTNLVSCAEGNIWVKTGIIHRDWAPDDNYYYRSGAGVVMTPWAEGHNEIRFNTDIYVTPGQYTLSFYSWYTYLTTNIRIRPNLMGKDADIYFDDQAFMPPPSTPTKHTLVLNVEHTGKVILRFVTMTPWTDGYVYFSDVKLERGNTATDWSPYPGDPASALADGSSFMMSKDAIRATTKTFEIAAVSEDGTQTQMRITKDGAEFGRVKAPNLAYAYDGPDTIAVKPDATSDEIAAGGVYKSLPEALAALNNRQLAYDVTINVMGDSYGFEELYGVHGSRNGIVINGNKKALIGRFRAVNCSTNIAVNGLTFAYDSAYGKDYAVNFDNCSHVDLKNCVITGNMQAARGAWFAWGTRAYLEACEFYDVTDSAIKAGDNVDLLVMNAKGSVPYFVWADGAVIKWGGTRPAGSYWEGLPSICNKDLTTLTVDYGSAAPTVPTVTTAEYPMQHADSYAGGYENSWDYQQHDDIMQGYTEHAGRIYGCIWFDNAAIRAAVAGKTVKQATIRLKAQTYVGRGVAVEVHLWGTTTEYAGRSGAPELTSDYKIIGTATPGETTTISIPIEAAADLASGTINGLVLYSDDETLYGNRNYSRNYMRFDGDTSGDASTRPVLTVTYQ